MRLGMMIHHTCTCTHAKLKLVRFLSNLHGSSGLGQSGDGLGELQALYALSGKVWNKAVQPVGEVSDSWPELYTAVC